MPAEGIAGAAAFLEEDARQMSEESLRQHDLVIIGGGLTGLTAGIYAARARMDARLMEGRLPGGQLLYAELIENYPGFPEGIMAGELAEAAEKQARRFGLQIERIEVEALEPRQNDFLLRTSVGDISARAVIVCTGGKHKSLGVPGEFELAGKGVSYCARCDGFLFRDKEIVVVGGGNTAMDESLFLARLCRRVQVVHRRDELRAEKILQERAFANPKIEFIWSSVVTEIHGNQFLESVVLKNVQTEETREMPTEGVFIAIGMEPAVGFLPESVERDKRGFIITDREMRTSLPGLFAAGDVVSGSLRQLATGVGEAAIALVSAQEYLDSLERKSS
jgi:thioredoxin reductase (NADPH)